MPYPMDWNQKKESPKKTLNPVREAIFVVTDSEKRQPSGPPLYLYP